MSEIARPNQAATPPTQPAKGFTLPVDSTPINVRYAIAPGVSRPAIVTAHNDDGTANLVVFDAETHTGTASKLNVKKGNASTPETWF